MSTKVSEHCPKCSSQTAPGDDFQTTNFVGWKPWRYTCSSCGWVWANEAQRKHNEHHYHQMKRGHREHINS